MTRASRLPLEELLQRQMPGMSLEQPFYTDPRIFEEDLRRIIARQWLFVDHVSVIPKPGDVITWEIAGESIILVRGKDREIRAFFNVCRNRGSRIVLKDCDHLRTLTCPYHAWTWDLEGSLVRARLMPAERSSTRVSSSSVSPGKTILTSSSSKRWRGISSPISQGTAWNP